MSFWLAEASMFSFEFRLRGDRAPDCLQLELGLEWKSMTIDVGPDVNRVVLMIKWRLGRF